ncbi:MULTISPECIES: UDP-3-O-(3-hydroxymyristoyl)glucosamine N-acyltransferase [Rhodomicrobium]|uniref:UDP-3-O-(3-hydroxymyristoyl)glucosamine N-acyltransferase n=1 Tax=Rhodomicrobium TaxID=1068 RepID=UPI000B4B87D8|nr:MULTISPECIES: UDP-3-O-(3-hydroxymyristoyl)glucosamine N-acyltransferase [Rhodomicrobium]
MEHPGFYHRAGPFPLARIAEIGGAVLADEALAAREISDIRPLDAAGPSDVAFLDNPKYLPQLAGTKAAACFIQAKFAERVPPRTAVLVSPEPYRAYAKALGLFYPEAAQPKAAAPTAPGGAHIDPSAVLEAGVIVEPGAIIGPEAQIGAGTRIAAGAVIGYRCAIGRNCFIGPRAVITHALIGNNVIIHSGAAIGQDGFGFAMGRDLHYKVHQIGRVIIQDWVEIGANSAVDRGALRDTIIGEGTKIDNLVQIGHNVIIGRHCVLVAQVGISGSSVLEDFAVMGGQSGTVGHITIGAGAQVAGNSGVAESVPRGERWGGTPAKPLRAWAREIALMKRLTDKLSGKHLKDLTKLGE